MVVIRPRNHANDSFAEYPAESIDIQKWAPSAVQWIRKGIGSASLVEEQELVDFRDYVGTGSILNTTLPHCDVVNSGHACRDFCHLPVSSTFLVASSLFNGTLT